MVSTSMAVTSYVENVGQISLKNNEYCFMDFQNKQVCLVSMSQKKTSLCLITHLNDRVSPKCVTMSS